MEVTGLLLTARVQADLEAWLVEMHPQILLLSASPNDRPGEELWAALEGYPLLVTSQHGWIELTSDGEQMWVEVERR